MYALVVIACMAGQPQECRGFVSAERFAMPIACARAAMLSGPPFEQANPGWRYREAKCVADRGLNKLLRELNGEDV